MTKNYPEWQATLRAAQEECIKNNEETQAKVDEARLEEWNTQQKALASLLNSIGIGEGEAVPFQEEARPTRKIDNYLFYVRKDDGRTRLVISPSLIKDTLELLNNADVSIFDYENNKFALDTWNFELEEKREGPAWKSPLLAYELRDPKNMTAFRATIADTLDDIDQAVEKALEEAALRVNRAINAPVVQLRQPTFGEELAYLLDKHINALISNERAEYNGEY